MSSVFAQEHQGDKKRAYGYSNNNGNHATTNDYVSAERDAQVQRINRDFDQQVQLKRNDRWLRATKKNKLISKLEKEGVKQVNEVIAQYSRNKQDRFDDRLVKNTRKF